jgi:hypothetical protein
VPDPSTTETRTRRLVAYLRQNRDQMVVDAAVLLSWIVVSAALFRFLSLPQWLHYLVLFVGIGAYSRLTPDWERPYRRSG